MDYVTLALIAALSANLADEEYDQLKDLILQKFGESDDLVEAIALLEQRPNSIARREMLAEEMKLVGAHADDALVEAAEVVWARVKSDFVGEEDWETEPIPQPQREKVVQFSRAFLSGRVLQPKTMPGRQAHQLKPRPKKAQTTPPSPPPKISLLKPHAASSPSSISILPAPHDPTEELSLPTPAPPQSHPLEALMRELAAVKPEQLSVYTTVPATPPVDLTRLDEAEQQFAAMPTETVPAVAPLPAGSRMPLQGGDFFSGRQTELSQIAQAMRAGRPVVISQVESTGLSEELAAPRVQTTSELGGIGKTRLACEFVHRYGQYFLGGVFWLDFSVESNIPVEIIASGGALASHIRADFRNLLLEEQMELVLSGWQNALPKLLIFANCEDATLFTRWRPPKGACSILITSRLGNWQNYPVELLRLTIPAPQSMLSMLRQYRPDPLAGDLETVARALGYVPLALHLAGNFLAYHRDTLTARDYLKRLRQTNLLNNHLLVNLADLEFLTDHDQYILQAFMVSYSMLDTEDAISMLAQVLLVRAAYFAPHIPIPRNLLLATVHHGSSSNRRQDFWGKLRGMLNTSDDSDLLLQAREAVNLLLGVGLLEAASDGALRLHPLLAFFLREMSMATEAASAVRKTLLETSKLLSEGGSPTALLSWQPHLQAMLINQLDEEGQIVDLTSPFSGQLMGNPLYLWEKFYYERALAINEQMMGENHADTAQCLDDLGIMAGFEADYMSGQFYMERALAIRLAEFGENHPETARSFNNFGALLAAQGRFEQANSYYSQALAIREKVFGENHRETAQSLNNMGELRYQQEQYEAARPYFERALLIAAHTLGADHPETARVMSNLAMLLEHDAEYKQAQILLEQALQIMEAVLGKAHPDTATVLNNLGSLLESQRNYVEARQRYQQALRIRRAVLGDNHPDTATIWHNLAVLNFREEDFVRAAELMRQAISSREAMLGPQHPHTQISRDCLQSIERQLNPLRSQFAAALQTAA